MWTDSEKLVQQLHTKKPGYDISNDKGSYVFWKKSHLKFSVSRISEVNWISALNTKIRAPFSRNSYSLNIHFLESYCIARAFVV